MGGGLTGRDVEYHASVFHGEIILIAQVWKLSVGMSLCFFPSPVWVPLHGGFETQRLTTCLDPKYRVCGAVSGYFCVE